MVVARCESYGPTVKLGTSLCACEWVFRPRRMKQKLPCDLDVSPSCYYAKSLMIQCPLIGERVRSDRLETGLDLQRSRTKQKSPDSFLVNIDSQSAASLQGKYVVYSKAPD